MTQVDHGAGDAPSDAELILQVRSGDREAFGALYTRHASAARALATKYVTNPSDADDVVADAFSKLYEMLRRGLGPDSGFRTYLYTVVRHRAYDVSRGATRMRPAEDVEIEAALGKVASPEDPTLQGFERSVVSRAYFSLPERWREVLWYCLVDDLKPAQVAPVLGLTPNGVSALLYRAKDALRDGYLQQHLTHAPSDTCRAVNPHLGGYVRGSLSRREKAKIEAHLSTCGTCSALVLELADVAHGMKCVVAPLVLGAAGLALVGSAIPVGAGLAGAVKAASSAASTIGAGASSGGGAAGAVGGASAAGAAGAGAGTTTAAAGMGATAAAGSTATAGATAAATAGATAGAAGTAGLSLVTAAGVAGMTAGATAAGVVGAGGAAATTGAIGAGLVTVATVGVVAALQLMGPFAPQEEQPADQAPAAAVQRPEPTPAVPGAEGGGTEASAPPAEEDPADPTNLLPVAGGKLGIAFEGAGAELEPRRPQNLVLELVNTGDTATTGTTVRLQLPEGMVPAAQEGPSGAAWSRGFAATTAEDADDGADAPAAGPPEGEGDTPATEPGQNAPGDDGGTTGTDPDGNVPANGSGPRSGEPATPSSSAPSKTGGVGTFCTPDAAPGTVLCTVGALGAGEAHQMQVTVQAWSGGSYPIIAELWADGVEALSIALPAREVSPFGPELTALTDATQIASPGTGALPVRVGNTGDQGAAPGWSMTVSLPEGVRPAAVQEALTCTGGESRTWSCAPRESVELAPGAWRDLPLALVAVPPDARAAVVPASGTASVAPAGAAATQSARARLDVTTAWAGAGEGAGKVTAVCTEKGGLRTARTELAATYANTTQYQVAVALEAGGASVAHPDLLAPGESVTLRRDEGIRVPAGPGNWLLTRTVEGVTYEFRVPAGSHAGAECYAPAWDSKAKAATVNDGGAVGVQGTLANTSDEPMTVKMVVNAKAGQLASETKTVEPGASGTFAVATGQKRISDGSVSFQLGRWTPDQDGDEPASPAKPATSPKAAYRGAVVAPSYTAERTMGAECTYDAGRQVSTGRFHVPVDNTASTLPVTFRLGDAELQVPPGETGTLTVSVPWGTGTLPLVIGAGRTLGDVDVTFGSCAQVSWPEGAVEAEVTAQCVEGYAHLVADVRNSGDVAWTARLVRPWSGRVSEPVQVPAHGTTRLALDGAVWLDRDQHVVLKLSRHLEGAERTVEKSYAVPPVACEPTTDCSADSGATAWITALFGGCTPTPSPTPAERGQTTQTSTDGHHQHHHDASRPTPSPVVSPAPAGTPSVQATP
ncbi:sigma-70 family RNA polymerase sigma factor [Myceligenerans crystallogenes]|uniref:RNA polymerase sigma factor, sigma-70 family n=1 Tax=Myceligenerans crystallogenes TaxID=316335 RepID=A0ABP5A3F8_9MICO